MGLTERVMLEQLRDLTKKHLAYYQPWDKTKCINVVYDGAQASATVEVQAASLILCAPAGNALRTINLSAGATDTLAEVVADINTYGDGFSASLGDQWDGDEISVDLTIIGATPVKVAGGVWFARDTNLKIRVPIPAVPAGLSIKITKVVANGTYTGAGVIQLWNGVTKKWEEAAAATTVDKTATIYALSGDVGEQLIVKLVAATTLTDGFLSVSYEQKDAQPFSV